MTLSDTSSRNYAYLTNAAENAMNSHPNWLVDVVPDDDGNHSLVASHYRFGKAFFFPVDFGKTWARGYWDHDTHNMIEDGVHASLEEAMNVGLAA